MSAKVDRAIPSHRPPLRILALAVLLTGAVLEVPVYGQTSFQATLEGSQEVPPVTTSASGTASLTLNAAQDALTMSLTLLGVDLDGSQDILTVDRVTETLTVIFGRTTYRRGDVNVDGAFNLADAVFILNSLFGGTEQPTCEKAADGNDDDVDGVVDDNRCGAARRSGRDRPHVLSSCTYRPLSATAMVDAGALNDADIVIVDPPRKGLDAQVVQALLLLRRGGPGGSGPSLLVYVSCGFDAFARDCSLLSSPLPDSATTTRDPSPSGAASTCTTASARRSSRARSCASTRTSTAPCRSSPR